MLLLIYINQGGKNVKRFCWQRSKGDYGFQ